MNDGRQPHPMYEGRPLANPDEDIFDQGLAFDLETHLDRRRMLKLIGFTGLSAGLVALVGCAPAGSSASAAGSASAAATASAAASAAAEHRRGLRGHPGGDGRAVPR